MDTRKEAEVELFKKAEGIKDMFCPLINSRCNHNCICFVKAYISETDIREARIGIDDHVSYSVVGGYCGNGMFEQRG